MEPKSLFDKPMNELREAFVRARLAEPATFSHEEIVAWLEDAAQETDNFKRAPYFVNHFDELNGASIAEILHDNATPSAEPPEWLLAGIKRANRDPAWFAGIVRALQNGGAKVYYPWTNTIGVPPVAIIDNDAWILHPCIHASASPNAALSADKAEISDVLGILNGEILEQRPKMDAARAFLKQEARHAILHERKMAEQDFDEAVAVSTDGTRIVRAAEVVVLPDKPWYQAAIYPASAFIETKILRTDHMGRFKLAKETLRSPPRTIAEYVRWSTHSDHFSSAMRIGHGQAFDECRHFDGQPRLVTEARYCPSPLPDGGQTITV